MDKFFLKSKTIWGAIIAALPGLSAAFGWQISAGDIAEFGSQLEALLDALQALIGFILIWWGRQTAQGTLRVVP